MNENVEENENRGKNYKFQEWSYVISVVTLAFHSLITVSTGKLAIFHPIGKWKHKQKYTSEIYEWKKIGRIITNNWEKTRKRGNS